MFAGLLALEWIAGIAAAIWISPRTWSGAESATHLHIWAAVFLGGLISIFPVGLVLFRPGTTFSRHVITTSQMLMSALLIHLSGGRIETHFLIFGSLAFLACYRDWRVLITATVVVSADHWVRGVFYPQSVFGVLTASPWRVFEHSAWVLFENLFLLIAIRQSIGDMKQSAFQLASLEDTNQIVEAEVEARTSDLQKQTEALQYSHRRAEMLSAFGDILNRSLNEIFIFDAETLNFVHVNHGARENIGYTMDELREMTPVDIKPTQTASSFAKLVKPLVDGTEKDLEFKTVHRRKNGTDYPVEVHLEKSVLGEAKVFVAVILDITERQKIEKELQDSRKSALAADQMKSEFLANMSHEIRTPMTAILGFNDILLENAMEPEDVDAARTVKQNGDYLISLIDDILDLSKIEAGKVDMECVECSPRQIVIESAELLEVRATSKKLRLETEYGADIPSKIVTDPTRLRQILINLVGNAIKFTESGSVKIVTRLRPGKTESSQLQFDVIDTGIGISAEQVEKIFQPFTQADGSVTRRFGGTGLGLAISKRLVEALGGEITVSSKVGTGSTFSVTLPIGMVVEERASRPSSERVNVSSSENSVLPLQDRRILLAEDGPDNQRLISFILKKAGAKVTVADNGQIGWGLAIEAESEGNPFDVILMDMQMPVLDGYAATRKLREKGYSQPIIALTAHAMSSDRKKCLDAGCNDYATKPIDRKSLISLVSRWAERRSVEQTHTTP